MLGDLYLYGLWQLLKRNSIDLYNLIDNFMGIPKIVIGVFELVLVHKIATAYRSEKEGEEG